MERLNDIFDPNTNSRILIACWAESKFPPKRLEKEKIWIRPIFYSLLASLVLRGASKANVLLPGDLQVSGFRPDNNFPSKHKCPELPKFCIGKMGHELYRLEMLFKNIEHISQQERFCEATISDPNLG